MKITQILPVNPTSYGGVQRHFSEISKIFISDGNSLTCICPLSSNETSLKPNFLSGIKLIEIDQGKTLVTKIISKLCQFLFFKTMYDSEIVHFHDYGSVLKFFPLFIICLILNRKLSITFHGWEGKFPPQKKTILMRRIINSSISRSINVGDYIEKWYKTNPKIVIYGGYDCNKSKNYKVKQISSSIIKFVFIGRLEEDTGIRAYLESWLNFNPDTDCELNIYGNGSLNLELTRKINASKVTNVHFHGWTSEIELILQGADVVLTSGYLSVIESVVFEKKVVSYYDNELKEDYLKLWIDAQNYITLCGSTHELLDAYYHSVYKKSSDLDFEKFRNKYSWRNVVEKYYDLWK